MPRLNAKSKIVHTPNNCIIRYVLVSGVAPPLNIMSMEKKKILDANRIKFKAFPIRVLSVKVSLNGASVNKTDRTKPRALPYNCSNGLVVTAKELTSVESTCVSVIGDKFFVRLPRRCSNLSNLKPGQSFSGLFWKIIDSMYQSYSTLKFSTKNPSITVIRESMLKECGLGRDRTGDLTIFSRSLVPTELPSQTRF